MAWHSMITRRNEKRELTDKAKEKLKQQMAERDQNFRENWQNYEDEKHIGDD